MVTSKIRRYNKNEKNEVNVNRIMLACSASIKPLLVIAGAGSGKTKTLAHKVEFLNVALINQQSYTLIDHMKRIEDFPEALEGKRVKDWIREDELPNERCRPKEAPHQPPFSPFPLSPCLPCW